MILIILFNQLLPGVGGGDLKQNQVSAKLGLFPLEPLMVDVFSMFSIDGSLARFLGSPLES